MFYESGPVTFSCAQLSYNHNLIFNLKFKKMKERISIKDVPQELMAPMLSIGNYLKKSGLEEKLLRLIEYRVSQLNG